MSTGRLWGGRFEGGPSEAMFALSKSTQFDWRLALHDIAGSRAHAKALRAAGYLDDAQASAMDEGLAELARQVEAGEFVAAETDEDVHGALERGLKLIVGDDLGGRIRAGRSRNDQIATLIRGYLRDEIRLIALDVDGVIEALLAQADANLGAVMPGRTHLQHAQPRHHAQCGAGRTRPERPGVRAGARTGPPVGARPRPAVHLRHGQTPSRLAQATRRAAWAAVNVLTGPEWRTRAARHRERVEPELADVIARRDRGIDG